MKEAAGLKCERGIAIADCITIALVKALNGKAIFYRKEREFEKTLEKKPF